MADVVENFQVGSNNVVAFALTGADGNNIANLQNATRVDIHIGNSLVISRTTNNQDGVDYSQGNGKITINPGLLTEDLSVLKAKRYEITVRVKDNDNAQGVIFGGKNASSKLYFDVSFPPSAA